MIKLKIFSTILCAGAMVTATVAQTVSDALRFSTLQPASTARSMGAGNAFGALGADFSAASQNPAGIALFRSDELMFTVGMRFANTNTRLAGTTNTAFDEEKYNPSFNNIGLVFNNSTRRNSKWSNVNFALGLNRLASYNRNVYYKGVAPGSVLNGWFQEAKADIQAGVKPEDLYPFGAGLAWEANAIYYQNGPLSYDFIGNPNAPVTRVQNLTRRGSTNELVFSFAGNYNEKLMLGATVGVPFASYTLEGVYEESDPNDDTEYFDALKFTEYVRTDGTGFNLKLGAIYRPTQIVRLGVSLHTPTFYNFTDSFYNTLTYTFTDKKGTESTEAKSPDGTTEYLLRTPLRSTVSGALLLGKYGFLSGDVEWVDYGKGRFNFSNSLQNTPDKELERSLNSEIGRSYQRAVNVRLGAELAVENFRLRGGYNLLGEPYTGSTGFAHVWSAGAGLRFRRFYMDAAYRQGTGTGFVQAYADAPRAVTSDRTGDFLLTLGFKF